MLQDLRRIILVTNSPILYGNDPSFCTNHVETQHFVENFSLKFSQTTETKQLEKERSTFTNTERYSSEIETRIRKNCVLNATGIEFCTYEVFEGLKCVSTRGRSTRIT